MSSGVAARLTATNRDLSPQMTRNKPTAHNRAPLMRLSGQPALKVRLAASSKRDGNERVLVWS